MIKTTIAAALSLFPRCAPAQSRHLTMTSAAPTEQAAWK